MVTFSPELFKAASGAQTLPVSKEQSDDPFETPVYEQYIAKNDLTGYMTALWKGVAARNIESMRVLFYLAVRAHELDNAIDIMDMLMDTNDEYIFSIWYFLEPLYKKMEENNDKDLVKLQEAFDTSLLEGDKTYQELCPEYKSMFSRFGDTETALLRAYINNAGRQPLPEEPTEEVPIHDCAPQEKRDYWRSLYRRTDCSSNQASIYEEARRYAEKGDPYAMYIVGYSLSHGIVTKYSSPQIVLLPANKDAALPWLKKATKAQIPQAFWELGNIYFDRSMKEEGLDCIRRGAELDEAQCLRYLIQYKDDDAAKVQHLSRLVEENNDNKARLQLAEHYEEGTGCAINPQKAFELVEYVYNHTSVSPYDSSHEDSAEKLMRYLRTGFGCEKDPERAGRISSSLDADNDWMWELLTK